MVGQKSQLLVLLSQIMGGDCDAMILAAAQEMFWPTRFLVVVLDGYLICIDAFYLRKLGKIPYVLVLTCGCPRG